MLLKGLYINAKPTFLPKKFGDNRNMSVYLPL